MAKPVIAYRSMLRVAGVTISDPGTANGFDRADLSDLRSYKGWKSSGTGAPINFDIDAGAGGADADYIGLVNSNLCTLGATIRVLAGAASPAATEVLAPTAITSDQTAYLPFVSIGAKRYWRVTINTASPPFSAQPFIGEMPLGLQTVLPEYIAPTFDPFFSEVEVAGQRSEGGHYLGATVRGKTHRGIITFGAAGAARAAFTSDLNAFLDNHALLRKPFLFILDASDSDFATPRWIRMTDGGNAARLAVQGSWSRLEFSLDVEEAMMEPAS